MIDNTGGFARDTAKADHASTAVVARYTRFLMMVSVIGALLIIAPVMTVVLRNPKGEVFSLPLILWIAGVLGVTMLVVIMRGRRLRVELSQQRYDF